MTIDELKKEICRICASYTITGCSGLALSDKGQDKLLGTIRAYIRECEVPNNPWPEKIEDPMSHSSAFCGIVPFISNGLYTAFGVAVLSDREIILESLR